VVHLFVNFETELTENTLLRSIAVDFCQFPEFFEVRNEFYKDTQGAILVFDVTNRESFEGLDNWLAEAIKFGANTKEVPIVLCANNKLHQRREIMSRPNQHMSHKISQNKRDNLRQKGSSTAANRV
jgi:GTPase SAR1 family protein